MLRSHVRMLSPDSQSSSLETSFMQETGGADTQQSQNNQGGSYNELRKLQRLYEKQSKELDSIRNEFSPLKQQLSQFQSMFSGRGSDDGKPMSYVEKVRYADRSIKEQDPSSNGLALTLEGAELIEQMRAQNEQMRQQMQKMNTPQYVAEQNFFVHLEGGIKEEMERFFGETGVDDNYPDFERVAISKLKEINKDPKKWAQLLRSPEMQKQFVRAVIQAKMPKLENVPGWKKIETYSIADAQRDLNRSEQMATKAKNDRNREMMIQASQLAEKARQRLLPETLGLRFRDDV